MTTTADLKPGDVVQHSGHGYGIVYVDSAGETLVVHCSAMGRVAIGDLTGWERAEIVKPGHVQVRVDDLDRQTLSEWSQWAGCDPAEAALLRVGRASIARQVGQGDPPADEKPTSTTVTLFCPVEGCGEPVEVGVHLWALKNIRDCYVTSECRGHRCKPAQPDEPTEFGARVTVTRPDGTREKWLRSEAGTSTYAWRVENGREFGRVVPIIWDNIIRRGTVSLGWGDES